MDLVLRFLIYFFRQVLNTFFRDIKVRGSHKIPSHGPVIFAVAPHANQFVDPLMLLVSSGRTVGFLAAKKSMDKFWIGTFGRLFHAIPVQRPQDITFNGAGTIMLPDESNPLILRGIDTHFTLQFGNRFQIQLPKEAGTTEIESIISDTELRIKKPLNGDKALAMLRTTNESGSVIGTKYKIVPYVDQSEMFSEVTKRLFEGGAVGIFPEGGSHDRPEMLPLKAGVCIMALDTMVQHPGLPVKIVPCGLNYFHADKFRSRAVIEYGDPIEVPQELVEQYKRGGNDKRLAIGLLLDTVTVSLKSLTFQAPDFETLMVIQAVRRLYTPANKKLDMDQALALSRNFAEAFLKVRDDPRVKEFVEMLVDYNRLLKYYGVQDHQVKNTNIESQRALGLIIYRLAEITILFLLALPAYVSWLPRGIFALLPLALAGSSVKIAGKDVVTTWKLMTAAIVVPVLWTFYVLLSFFVTIAYRGLFNGFSTAILNSFLTGIILPILGFASVRISDIGIDILKSLPPLIVSLTTPEKSSMPLRELRAELAAR
eukprot:jgi/Hompol1/98/HPOL_005224-RA